jgi:peptide/nickel transport system permease protein
MSRRAVPFFIARRLAAFALLLVALSFLVFSLLYIAPGNVVYTLLGTNPKTPATIHALRKEYHLDEPFLTQYWIWAKQALRFDFGNSISTTLPVTDEVKARLPTSLFLGIYAFILTTVFGVSLGVISALRKQTATDRTIVAGTTVGLSTPAFVSGVLLLYVFAILLPWFPAFGKGSGFIDELWHMTLPAIALSLVVTAYVVKHTRAAMIRVLDQDYVVFARARGLSAWHVLTVYELRNALVPIVTIAGLILSFLITGAVLVEVTFSLPGIGSLLVQSANTKDLPMIQGLAIVIAVVVMGVNLVADLIYLAIDPRIRLGQKAL